MFCVYWDVYGYISHNIDLFIGVIEQLICQVGLHNQFNPFSTNRVCNHFSAVLFVLQTRTFTLKISVIDLRMKSAESPYHVYVLIHIHKCE